MKKWVFALAVAFGVAIPVAVAEDGPFSDVPAKFWAADAIDDLEEAEVIEGTQDAAYNPREGIQRDEAARILADALNLELDGSFVPDFSDIQPGDFAYEEVAALTELGVLNNSEVFNPDEVLTRSGAAKLIAEAFDLQPPADAPAFTDVPTPHWASEYAQAVAGLGILEGATQDTFEPDGEVSRAYFAVVVDRALDYVASLTGDKDPADQAEETPAGTYTVKSGDTLYEIALSTGATVDELKQWNDLQSNVISIGQELKVAATPEETEEKSAEKESAAEEPAKEVTTAEEPPTEEPPTEEPPAEEEPAEETPAEEIPANEEPEEEPQAEESAAPAGTYTVKSGDTLYQIALNTGATVDELKQWNNLQSNIIDVGRELKVPATADGAKESPVKETPTEEKPTEKESAVEKPAEKAQPAVSGEEGLSADEQRSIELVNLERSKIGAGAVVADPKLSRIAQVKAEDMAQNHYFDHTSPTYGSPFEMAYDFGYSYQMYGENLAIGYTTPGAAMTGWMGSDSHRMNLLNEGYTQIGVGHAVDEAGTDYWVHLFSRQ